MKVFQLNATDYVAAETLEEAKKCLAEKINDGVVDANFEDEYIDNPFELTEKDLKSYTHYDEGSDLATSFKKELDRRIAANEKFPQYFSSED